MRHAAAALVLSVAASSALAQDQEQPKEMESQSQIADRIVAEQQGLKIREVEGVMSATPRAFEPIEGGSVDAPGGPGGEAGAAAAGSAASAKKANESGGIPWGIVAGAMVSLAAVVVFVRAWRRAGESN